MPYFILSIKNAQDYIQKFRFFLMAISFRSFAQCWEKTRFRDKRSILFIWCELGNESKQILQKNCFFHILLFKTNSQTSKTMARKRDGKILTKSLKCNIGTQVQVSAQEEVKSNVLWQLTLIVKSVQSTGNDFGTNKGLRAKTSS